MEERRRERRRDGKEEKRRGRGEERIGLKVMGEVKRRVREAGGDEERKR